MTTLMEILEAAGSLLVGMGGRLALSIAGGLALAIPAVLLGVAIHVLRQRRARAVPMADGLAWRPGAYFAPNHTWLAPGRRTGEFTVGVDDLARHILPSVTSVELPRPGMSVHRGDPIVVLRAGGRTVRMGAPVDGRVMRVNPAVRRDPGLVHREPYGGGWLFTLAPADAAYMRLPQDREAGGWLAAERTRLTRFVESELGLAAADGGVLVEPLPAALGEEGWRKVVFAFLHAA